MKTLQKFMIGLAMTNLLVGCDPVSTFKSESIINLGPIPNIETGDNSILLEVTADNNILLNKNEITLNQLSSSIDNLHLKRPITGAHLSVHLDARHGLLVEIKSLLDNKRIPTDLQLIRDPD